MNNARKITSGLLAVYMLTLVLIPCNDNCDSQQHQTPTTFQAAQEHHEHDNHVCSPFCSCSCCSTLITLVPFAELRTFVQTRKKAFPLYRQSFISAFADDYWQPPRLS